MDRFNDPNVATNEDLTSYLENITSDERLSVHMPGSVLKHHFMQAKTSYTNLLIV